MCERLGRQAHVVEQDGDVVVAPRDRWRQKVQKLAPSLPRIAVNVTDLGEPREPPRREFYLRRVVAQSNLANTYSKMGRLEEALQIERDVYSGRLKLNGEEHYDTLIGANNYANSLTRLDRFEEAKALLLRMIPVARRVLGESHDVTLRIRAMYARPLYQAPDATLDDLREAVTTLEDLARIARRVLGGAHPVVAQVQVDLGNAQAALRARETPSPSA